MEYVLYELLYFPRSLAASWNVISLLLPPPLICGSNAAGNLPTAGKVINQPTQCTHVEMHAHSNIYVDMKAHQCSYRYKKRIQECKGDRGTHAFMHIYRSKMTQFLFTPSLQNRQNRPKLEVGVQPY